MTASLKGLRLRVIGAGAFGLATAVAAARRGAQVSVFSADPLQASASAVAAGMLSPVFEAVEGGREHFPLLCRALEAWSRFDALIPLDRSGALYLGPDLAETAAILEALGVDFDLVDAAQAQRRQPALSLRQDEALFTPMDARVSPGLALEALTRQLTAAGGAMIAQPVPSGELFEAWQAEADAVVIAAGYASRRWSDYAPVLARLSPIKGHILHFEGGPVEGATVRTCENYIAPQLNGAVFGATMQMGCADKAVEPEVAAALMSSAATLAPALAESPHSVRVGVRAASPDGLPLAGRLGPGLFAATAARRNGWLLAPLVADAVVAVLAGATGEPGFDPARFC